MNPRVIDDPVWLKLVWANLNLRKEDLLSEIHYPLSMLQAMAVIWTHAGLRQNELMRLTTECVTPQADDILQENGSAIPAGTLCYLSVLIDHDPEAASLTGPATYYDLGDSYCTPPFWSSCQHRMACIGCDFNLLKQPGGISIPC